jgi:hypothetical protein
LFHPNLLSPFPFINSVLPTKHLFSHDPTMMSYSSSPLFGEAGSLNHPAGDCFTPPKSSADQIFDAEGRYRNAEQKLTFCNDLFHRDTSILVLLVQYKS